MIMWNPIVIWVCVWLLVGHHVNGAVLPLSSFFDSSLSVGTSNATASASATATATSVLAAVSAYSKTVANAFAYAPTPTVCPSGSWAREAGSLCDAEKTFVSQRQAKTNPALVSFLHLCNLDGFDAEAFVANASASRNITVAIAVSGGSYRAQFVGAGALLAMDGRYDKSNSIGLGGLMQASTYISALSGGGWLVGSLACANWISISQILDGTVYLWDISTTFLLPKGWLDILGNTAVFADMIVSIQSKFFASFPTSFIDIWSRLLATQLFTDKRYGVGFKWSDLTQLSLFQDHDLPFPFLVACGRVPGTYVVNTNSTVFEMTPYEIGSWDPAVNGMVQTPYLGSKVDGGTPLKCYGNFDNASFLMGTSSSVFAAIILNINQNPLIPKFIVNLINGVYGFLTMNQEVSIIPNPFRGVTYGNSDSVATNENLFLVDGGIDGQNIPLSPLLHPQRNVDIIFAYDSSADTDDSWPDGAAMVNTYLRQFSAVGHNTVFPPVPSNTDFLSQGLTQKPVFFGCYASEMDHIVDAHANMAINVTDIPVVVYTANRDYSYSSNGATTKIQYLTSERNAFIDNGFDIAANVEDTEFRKCVGCAIIKRTQERLGLAPSDECQACFSKYCWKGEAATQLVI